MQFKSSSSTWKLVEATMFVDAPSNEKSHPTNFAFVDELIVPMSGEGAVPPASSEHDVKRCRPLENEKFDPEFDPLNVQFFKKALPDIVKVKSEPLLFPPSSNLHDS